MSYYQFQMSFLEIYMLWELKGVKYLSVRAYYFPEDTVEGRFPEQGQVSDNVAKNLEDPKLLQCFTNCSFSRIVENLIV